MQGKSGPGDREASNGNSLEMSSDEENQKPPKDTEYGGLNITNLWREMSLQKMWHERTWTDIVKHFATTLIVSVLPTFYDCGTDVTSVMKYWREAQNLEEMGYKLPYENETYSWKIREYRVYSGISLILIFLPGLFFSMWIRKAHNLDSFWWRFFFHPVSPFTYLLFPFILVTVKLIGLINPGTEWKKLTLKMTCFEGDFEASLQLLLNVYIVLAADGPPKWWQVASLTGSMVMVTKTAIADFLFPRQPMTLKEELVATLKLIPLFLTNCTFKVLSLAITAWTLWVFSLTLFPITLVLLHLPDLFGCCSCCCCYRFKYLTLGTPKHMIKLYLIQEGTKTTKQTMRNFLYNNIFWMVNHSIYLGLCLLLLPTASELRSGFKPKLDPMLRIIYSLYVVIFSAIIVNLVLIYFQVWRPYKRAEKIEMVGVIADKGEGTMIQEEGSKCALMTFTACCCVCCSVIIVIVGIIVFLIWSVLNYFNII